MIHYALKCDAGHGFDSWFKSAAAFEALQKAGHLSCAHCGSSDVTKAIMAPRVATRGADGKTASAPKQPERQAVIRDPSDEVRRALADLRRKVEANSDYVGTRFASEARAMHLGEKPERSIYGEARPHEARALIEEGVPLMPLPCKPRQKLT